jgi:hypothetical protein
MTSTQIVENERTAMAQKVSTLPDGPGLRIGKRSVLVGIIPLVPGGGSKFRERLPQFQAEAAYWEERVGTVHDFNMFLFDNDTKMYFTVVYDGDFKPYLEDLKKAAPWFDNLIMGVGDGWKGMNDPGFVKYLRPSSPRSFSMPITLRPLAETLRKPCVCKGHLSTCWMKHSHD